ncbi:MAG: hypothetical protein P1P85_05835 [Patescibacteria group bacterium]|nr:hypothetical protein [Patescibacteria group bacterium]
MGKEKVKKDLDKFCTINSINFISISTIGRIIKEKKIYHHRQKIYHNGRIKKDFLQKLEIAFPYKIKAVQTDNGSEFHKFFKDYLKEKKITHYWNYARQPYKNGHIEKYNRTIQEEFID